MDLFEHLSEIIKPTENITFCRNCEENQSWECNSKIFHYCGIRKSNRTSNGLLKIKNKNIACILFKNKQN